MIHITSISNAIYTLIASNSVLVSSDTHVVRYEKIDTSPNMSPYVNVMRPSFQIEGIRANISQPYMATVSAPVYCQVMHTQDDEQAQIELDLLTNSVITAINSGTSRTLENTVNIVLGYSIEPIDIATETDDYLYANEITIIAEVFT